MDQEMDIDPNDNGGEEDNNRNNGGNGVERNQNVEENDGGADGDNNNNENGADAEDAAAAGEGGGNNNNGILDGGVAVDSSIHVHAADCPMVLFLECDEELSPSIPIKTIVSIGVEKATKLSAVFDRFCNFVNTYKHQNKDYHADLDFKTNHLEFVHCSILNPTDTVETSALMKDDKIKVQRNQQSELKRESQWAKELRESDKKYYTQMRNLLPDLNPAPFRGGVLFHCKGKVKDEQGYKQEVLSTFVRGHSSILSQRCPWLALKIKVAKDSFMDAGGYASGGNISSSANAGGSAANNIHHDEHKNDHNSNNNNMPNPYQNNTNQAVPIPESDSADLSWQVNSRQLHIASSNGNRANAVIDDDDEHDFHQNYNNNSGNANVDCIAPDHNECIRASSPVISSFIGTNTCNTFQVTLMHPPEAVKLLLEYCYTNRVVLLGKEAFHKSYKPIEIQKIAKEMVEHSGPLEPFAKNAWPKNGMPAVSLSVALAGLQLAEEARLPRLSLMCEIAASQLISSSSLLKALALCEEQKQKTGNNLLHLRKAVMLRHILGRGPRGVSDLSSMPSFQRTLKEERNFVVPSLMKGVLETVKETMKIKNNDSFELDSARIQCTAHHFAELDDVDKRKRDFERIKRRKERWSKRSRTEKSILNPYGLEKRDFPMCSSRVVNDDMDFLCEERNESLFRARKYCGVKGENMFDFSEDTQFEVSLAGYEEIHFKRSERSSSQNKKRRS